MRKLALLIVIVSTLLVSCGKDHSPITGPIEIEPNKHPPRPDSTAVVDSTSATVPDSTAAKDSTSVPIPIPDPIPEPTPTNSLLQPVPASDLVEKIPFLVNKDYMDEHPEAEGVVLQIVEDANTVFARSGIKKRYELWKVMTYPNAEALYSIRDNPDYFYDNNFVGNSNYGGTTVVYWLQEKWGENAQFFIDRGVGTSAGYTNINGKKYGLVYIVQLKTENPLLGRSNSPTLGTGLSAYDVYIAILLHELGHTLGCSSPEWYALKCSDNSGTIPNIAYDMQEQNSCDPMSGADVGKYNIREYKFSQSNSDLINLNANHQIDSDPINEAVYKMRIQVKVVCKTGLVEDAIVKVYCGLLNDGGFGTAVNMEKLLQQTKTNRYGVASIDGNTGSSYDNGSYIIGVKASYEGKNAGSVITIADLQKCIVDGLDTFVLTLYLQ